MSDSFQQIYFFINKLSLRSQRAGMLLPAFYLIFLQNVNVNNFRVTLTLMSFSPDGFLICENPATRSILTTSNTSNTYILLDILVCSIANIFLRVVQYFGEPEGRVKIQMMSKNLQRYYTLKCLIRDLLSNVFISPKF